MQLRHLMESGGGSNFLDINQDEIPDLVMTNTESFSIAIGEYDSTGHLQFTMVPNQAFINSVYFTYARAADWDNDGDVDLIPEIHYVYEYHSVLTENVNGQFADTSVRFSTPFPELMTTQFHDFNQDGFVDAFFSKNGKTYIRNGDTGALLLLPMTPNGTTGTAGLSLLDINRDGWMDVLRMKSVNAFTELHLSLGKSGFEFEPELFLYNGKGNPKTNVGDFDGDGIGDFLRPAPYPSEDTVLIHTNLLSGNPTVLALNIPSDSKLFYPDINQDGLTDIVFTLSDTFHLRLNLGNGQFDAHHFLMQTPSSNATTIHPNPLGIGQDFFATNIALRIRYNFYYQNGAFSVTASENTFTNGIALGDNYANSCLADLDGDGNRELVLGMWNNCGIATASLSDSIESSRILYSDFHGEEITAIAAADFDLDGRDELVFFDRAGALQLGEIDSSGKFEIAPPLFVDEDFRNIFMIKVADFDGNGYPDFIFWNNLTDEVILMANQNGSEFTRHVVISDFNLQIAKVIDYDYDGLPDLIFQPYPANNPAYIYKNQGNLLFTITTLWPPGNLGRSPEEGPLTNTIVLRESNTLRLAEITPTGFQVLGTIEVDPSPAEYSILDYNRDSLPDIYYKKSPGKSGYICLNNGDGTFVKDAVLVPHIEVNQVFDLEKDGIPEFLAISRRDWMWGTSVPEVVVSAANDPSIEYDLSLWPSPTRELLRVQEVEDEPIESVDIYAISGALCKRIPGPLRDRNIQVGDLTPGAYILVARYAKGVERLGRFVVAR